MFQRTGSGASRFARPSVLRLLALCGAVACTSLVVAAPAGAVTKIPLQFKYAVLDLPKTGGLPVITPAHPLLVNATITGLTPTGATFVVQKADWTFPTYSFSTPAPGTINVSLSKPASGSVDFTTGAVSLQADLLSDVTLTGIGDCKVDTGTLNMGTATTEPLLGQAFPTGATGIETGKGALGTGWKTLPAGSGTGCALLNGYLSGVGGLWISGNLPPASLKVGLAKPRAVKAGMTRKIKATFKNAGGTSTGSIKACLKAPKGFKNPLNVCKTVTNVPPGKTVSVTFKVKPLKKKTKKYTLKLTAKPAATGLLKAPSSSNPTGVYTASVKLKVLN